jgi:hypothetical protein
MKCTGAGWPLGNIRRLWNALESRYFAMKTHNFAIVSQLRSAWHACKPLFRLTVPGSAQCWHITRSFSARYRPLSSYRSQHQDVTISAELAGWAVESKRYWVAVYCHFGRTPWAEVGRGVVYRPARPGSWRGRPYGGPPGRRDHGRYNSRKPRPGPYTVPRPGGWKCNAE